MIAEYLNKAHKAFLEKHLKASLRQQLKQTWIKMRKH